MILHVDFDAFFSSIEEMRNPSLKGKPVVVCAFTKEGKSGVVMTANYEARKHGIKSGMPLYLAKQKLKDAYYIEGDKKYYESISEGIMKELEKYGDIEITSIDEAYIEVDKDWEGGEELAKRIKHEIEKKFGIKLSVGIGKTLTNAKIASKLAKPDGIRRLKSIKEIKGEEVSIIPGIGEKTKEKLNSLGIRTVGDLIEVVNKNSELITRNFGDKMIKFLFEVANDRGREHVEEESKNSTGKIITLIEETYDKEKLLEYLEKVVDLLYKEKLENVIYDGVRIIVFVGNETVQRTRKLKPTRGKEKLLKVSKELIYKVIEDIGGRKIRRIGVFADILKESNSSLLDYF